ncbi:MAG TPA: sulfate adenylyltransferase subunit CysN [Solirubrobacteraceae bacterium]|nr:sulfate adenylyltransferase subunit CysN [Solirubrobacteraceae bacterium]
MSLASADLLRLATAGSVDDGKSTLIGRLLFDAKQVLTDQLAHVEEASRRRGAAIVDLSLLVDGLRAEREQGITIDVAYRYFATAQRTFIIADTPGHVQYTRNMVTGASTADLAVILVDARKGLLEQSKRHAFISSLLGIAHLVVAVNKMDLVDYDEETFDTIVRDFSDFARGLGGVRDIVYVPISARDGDNVVDASPNMPWYGGTPLLEHLETVQLADDRNLDDARFPVQWVIRDHDSDYRGYAGQLAGGILRSGDEVLVLPSGQTTRIARIDTFGKELDEAVAGMSVTLLLDDEIDVSRGDIICHADRAPQLARELDATVCWMSDAPLRAGARYAIKHATHSARAIVDDVVDRIDVHTLSAEGGASELGLNDIGRVRLRTSKPMAFDPYARNRATGSFILIDDSSNDTVGAGMIV